jgi:Putative adhesin
MVRLLAVLLFAATLVCAQTKNAGNLELSLAPKAMLTLDLSSGDYRIEPGPADKLVIKSQSKSADRHKVRFGLNATPDEASVKVDGPRNFAAIIQIPSNVRLNVRLNGGRLTMARIAGDKDIESNAGKLSIDVGHPDDYGIVDASVNLGEIDAPAFHGSKSGALQSFNSNGPGKYRLHVHVGTGQIRLFTDEAL